MPRNIPASQGDWEMFEIFGEKALFSNYRIDRDTIPEGLFAYDLRDDDDQSGTPREIKDFVLVNHYGTVVMKSRIQGDTRNGTLVGDDDFSFAGGNMTIEEFMAWKNSDTEEWPDA